MKRLKGRELVLAWEKAKPTMTQKEFARSLGRTPRAVHSEIYRVKKKLNWRDGAKVLIFDIEISPIIFWGWRLGQQYVNTHQVIEDWFILSWAAKWLDGDEFGAAVTPKEAINRDDKRICADLWELFDRADILIAHNLKKFDRKKANWRFKVHGFGPPLPYKMVDTLTECRSHFGATSNKLDYLLKQLGLRYKLETDYELWLECMDGNKKALKKMLNYNINDVSILEKLYLEIRPWIANHPNVNLYETDEVSRCPVCGSDNIEYSNKKLITTANAYTTYRCKCGHVGRTKISETSKDQRTKLLR